MPLFAKLALFAAGVVSSYTPNQEFGRFGFLNHLDLPGMEITKEGFHSKSAAATTFAFSAPSTSWRALDTAPTGQTILLDGGNLAPKKVSSNLFTPWVNLFCPNGCELKLPKTHKVFLTWPEGSVTLGVPTPETRWVLVSFDSPQPPLLLAVPEGKKTAFQLTDATDGVHLEVGGFKGWIQVAYPTGSASIATTTVGDLGKLVKKVSPILPFLMGPEPHLVSAETHATDQGIVATWSFTGLPIVPPPLKLAPQGGYGVKLLTKASDTGLTTEDGPIVRSDEPIIKVFFPCRSFPAGRAITNSGQRNPLPATVSSIDAQGVLELASENFCFDRDPLALPMSETAAEDYLVSYPYSMEEWTRQPVPYNAKNQGLALAGAYSLLHAVLALDDPQPQPPEFLVAVLDRLDWSTWMPYGELGVGREELEGGASAAAAAAFNNNIHIRLKGAMLEAGLAAQQVLHPSKTYPNSLALRKKLYHDVLKSEDPMFSQPRIFSKQNFVAVATAQGLELRWVSTSQEPEAFALALPDGTKVAAGANVAGLILTPQKGLMFVNVTSKASGPTSVVLLKKGLKLLPSEALAL